MLTQTYPRFTGDTAGTFIQSIAQALVEMGDDVHVLMPWDRALENRESLDGPELHTFRYAPTDALHRLGYSRTLRADVALKPMAYLLAPAYLAAGARALAKLARRLKADVVNAHWLVPNGVVADLARVKPLVVSLHGSDVYLAERRLYLRLAVRSLRHSRVLTGCSQDLVDRALAIHPVEHARCIPYGVDPQKFDGSSPEAPELRSRLNVAGDECLILAVGRIVPKKGFDVLVEALARLEPAGWRAVIVGAGEHARLERRAEELGLIDRVEFPGEVAHDELAAYYAAADVFVMPSVQDAAGNIDGLPNVVLEAMASGRAIVASRIAGIPAVIIDGETGLLVPERDSVRLADSIRQLIDRPDERRELGRRARLKTEAELTWKASATRYREAYLAAGAP